MKEIIFARHNMHILLVRQLTVVYCGESAYKNKHVLSLPSEQQVTLLTILPASVCSR